MKIQKWGFDFHKGHWIICVEIVHKDFLQHLRTRISNYFGCTIIPDNFIDNNQKVSNQELNESELTNTIKVAKKSRN